MKAFANMQCLAPKGTECEALDIRVDFEIPFVPSVGMALKMTKEGDYLTVTNIQWDVDSPNQLDIGVREHGLDAPLRPFAYWRRQGWVMA